MIEERDIACQTTLEYNDVEINQQSPQVNQQPQPLIQIQARQRSITTQQNPRQLIVIQTRTPKKQSMAHVADLKQQILDIAKKFDEILVKEQMEKNKVIVKPQDIQEQENQIKEQMQEIRFIQQQTEINQRRLQLNGEDVEITKLEDRLKYLQELERILREEYQSVKKISTKQQQALTFMGVGQQDEAQKTEKLNLLKQEKQKTKQLQEQLRQLENQSKQSHNSVYKQVDKLKWIDNRVQEYNKKKKKKIISSDDVEILESQLSDLIQEIEQKNSLNQSKIKELERERKQLTSDVEARERQMKEKDKELKLTLMKFNENKRTVIRNEVIKQ